MQTQISLATLKLHTQRLEQLIDELDNTFGDLIVHPKMTSEEIMYKAGQKNVVDFIKHKLEDDNDVS